MIVLTNISSDLLLYHCLSIEILTQFHSNDAHSSGFRQYMRACVRAADLELELESATHSASPDRKTPITFHFSGRTHAMVMLLHTFPDHLINNLFQSLQ